MDEANNEKEDAALREPQGQAQPHVFLAMPTYDGRLVMGSAYAWFEQPKTCHVTRVPASSSLLAKAFNQLWVQAILGAKKHGFTHFAMLHADVVPEPGWLDILLAEQLSTGADILSAVVAIKDMRGMTSCCIDMGRKRDAQILTLAHVYAETPTFWMPNLLVNTGCFICPLDRPWVRKVHFEITSGIDWLDENRCRVWTEPEDWQFSRMVRAEGGTIFATRKVRTKHVGIFSYGSDNVWGTESQAAIDAAKSNGQAIAGGRLRK